MHESRDKGDLDFEFFAEEMAGKTYAKHCLDLVRTFRKEFEEVKRVIKPMHKKAKLFEVMCASDSELTRQCLKQGFHARRFGIREGDLSTKKGRRNLFAHLLSETPEHLWYSPVCRPWCKWAAYNMSRSEELRDRVLQDRWENLWQVSLGILLYEHQTECDRHFHLEQPEGSAMLHIPCLGNSLRLAKPCTFDMCKIGHLKEPISQVPIRKRLVLCTTSKTLRDLLNSHKCPGEHDHFPVAGTTTVNGQTMAVSRFTEKYPRRFARQIVQVLAKKNEFEVSLAEEAEEDEHPSKRRRVGQKSTLMEIALKNPNVSWSHVLQAADATAPRVGVRIIEEGLLKEAVQRLCPTHDVQHLVLCRGTDRMLGPNKSLSPGSAPFRKMACIRRRFEDVFVENDWEKWENLSYTKRQKHLNIHLNGRHKTVLNP